MVKGRAFSALQRWRAWLADRVASRFRAFAEWLSLHIRTLLMSFGLLAVAVQLVVGFWIPGVDGYGPGLLVEGTSLAFGTFLVAAALDFIRRTEWRGVERLVKGRIHGHLLATHRSFRHAVLFSLLGKKVVSDSALPTTKLGDQFRSLIEIIPSLPQTPAGLTRTEVTPATPLQRVVNLTSTQVEGLLAVAFGSPWTAPPQVQEAFLKLESQYHSLRDDSEWFVVAYAADSSAESQQTDFDSLKRTLAALGHLCDEMRF